MENQNKSIETKRKLIEAGVSFFSKHGYDGTTTRMVAEAVGSNNAAVFFYFNSKEGFYSEVLNYVAARVQAAFSPLNEKVREARANGPLSPARAWLLIEEYIDLYINILRRPEEASVMYLLIHEQINPVDGHRPITAVACRDGENILKLLLRDYWQMESPRSEAIVSRLITSALVALAEHPQFIRMSLGIPDDSELSEEIWEEIRSCSLAMLRSYIPRA